MQNQAMFYLWQQGLPWPEEASDILGLVRESECTEYKPGCWRIWIPNDTINHAKQLAQRLVNQGYLAEIVFFDSRNKPTTKYRPNISQ